ncbi:hypothetical protein VRU48_16445 [Pedobacter sp. KR3-3]|uniref:Uncharacterized protein n=1 Tax=Pedobacter albus TaxID=3113905 RepID=A0ABU7IBG7_9SPHI|nr:hypothetical protein [Pedobacter sp. KR3-3]MEE1946716.1 hypothetical protein [Pedobacter sp. KR3-3]
MSIPVTVKIHPDKPTINTLPKKLPNKVYVIDYDTHLEIEGKWVLKFKITMLVRANGGDVEFSYQRNMKFGFLPPKSKDDFYYVCNYCYQTTVIEFNKTLDDLPCDDKYMDMHFESYEALKNKVDNALKPNLN